MNQALRFLASLVFAFSIAASIPLARATDYGDIWWNPAESGWGLQISQQGPVLFLTFYVYGSNGSPTWYTAAVTPVSAGSTTYTGALIASTGPYFGGPYAPPAANRVAGSVTVVFTSVATAQVTYSVDGVTVTKAVQRYAFSPMNLSGTYIGSFLAVQDHCANPGGNNQARVGSGTFTIAHAGTQVTITAMLSDNQGAYSCTFQGAYDQAGRLGIIRNGNYTCTDGFSGSFGASEIELSSQGGILGRYSGTNVVQGCQLTGGFGGIRP